MNDEVFNLDLRKFLKRFGVTAQREIERAVRDAIERGTLTGTETVEVRATLSIPDVITELRIDGQIGLDQSASRTSGSESS
jgi:hypothetical protein